MEFTLVGADPRFLYLKQRLEADGHRLTTDSRNIIAPPAERLGLPYWRDPVYIIENAALTAEGAAELIMRRTDRALPELSVLVAGYGRIGSLLSDRLAALGASVTAAARDPGQRALAAARGHQSVDITQIPDGFDVLVNTVPAPVLRGRYGAEFCLELASAPGGWADGTPVLKAPGLPGLYAPRSGADVMANAVYRVMEVSMSETSSASDLPRKEGDHT